MHKKKKNKRILNGIYAAAVVIIIAAAVLAFYHPDKKASKDVNAGLTYLKQMAGKSSSDIESNIKEMKKERERKERIEAREKALADGSITVWELFSDYIFLGDSRTVGFSAFGFLDESRVLAHSGDGIKNIADNLETVEYYNPSWIFICYGTNDLGIYASPEDYIQNLREQMVGLKEAAPHASFLINSIMPVYSDRLLSQSSNYGRIDEFNEAIKQMCEEDGYIYVDNTEIAQEHRSEYESDGIHFKASFYDDWALNLINGEDAV